MKYTVSNFQKAVLQNFYSRFVECIFGLNKLTKKKPLRLTQVFFFHTVK